MPKSFLYSMLPAAKHHSRIIPGQWILAKLAFLILCMAGAPCCTLASEPVSKQATELGQLLDAMEVEKHWLAGAIVNWRTGEPTGKIPKDNGKHTHCSQFVAAACERLGVYILRPPEHSPVMLANAQADWLETSGPSAGWKPVKDGVDAQDSANRGLVVVAIYKNPDPKKPGHVAIVRPDIKDAAAIAKDGPTVIQAGGSNYNSTSLRKGFANHPKSFGAIRYFAHSR